jgi:hypothetical protein
MLAVAAAHGTDHLPHVAVEPVFLGRGHACGSLGVPTATDHAQNFRFLTITR